MNKLKRKIGFLGLGILIFAGLYVYGVFVPGTDKSMNVVTAHNPYKIAESTRKFHDSLTIADLHGDTLMWRRNPEKRHSRGHIDLPRLREGGVNIQVFSTVTKAPRGLNFDGNSAEAPDNITPVAVLQFWPIKTWNSIFERAVFQARRLQKLEANPDNKLVIARNRGDMDQPEGTIIGLLLTEGSHPLEGKIENIDHLFDEGYRMMGLQHFFDNELGGSLHGVKKAGLTEFGRDAVRHMWEKDIIIDVAHSSQKTVKDVLAMSDRPVVISHGGLASHCPKTANRNLPDDMLREIARRGGLIGIGYFSGAICDISPAGIADTIIAAVNLMGEDAVALGSDFDGTVTTSLDTSELAAITQALTDHGVSQKTIRKVMGENVQNFLKQNLPE